MSIQTIQDAELAVASGLESLRNIPFNQPILDALSFVLPPAGYRLSVQFEEDGRKKRNTAAATNWNHQSGEIVLFFEPVAAEPSPSTLPIASIPEATLPRHAPQQPVRSTTNAATVPFATPPSTTEEQELRECCIALSEAEKLGRQFYAIKWFRDTFLLERGYSWTASQQDRQRVLNRAIQEGYIDTQSIPNPKNPAYPTTTLLLNRERTKSFVGSRFRPIPLRGEPLSETIIRERGER